MKSNSNHLNESQVKLKEQGKMKINIQKKRRNNNVDKRKEKQITISMVTMLPCVLFAYVTYKREDANENSLVIKKHKDKKRRRSILFIYLLIRC